MQLLDGRLVLSPTDLTHHQECAHLTRLDLGVAAGRWAAPDAETPEDVLFVFDRGLEHERKYLESLKTAGKSVEEIPATSGAEGRRRAEEQTVEAMRRGVDIVYQGTFFDGAWGGQADFRLRVDTPSPADQVLVVAPCNAQVALIKAALPGGARLGTVDKFQGQEAPVVIYSMTSTSAEDAPRGTSFLYDLNRLNAAVSRAQTRLLC